jgi:hypothetical protein
LAAWYPVHYLGKKYWKEAWKAERKKVQKVQNILWYYLKSTSFSKCPWEFIKMSVCFA